MLLPKVTTPLTKAIRTTEGVLIAACSVATAVFSALDPSKLPPKEAAIVSSAAAATLVVQRGVLKVVALTKGGADAVDLEAVAAKVASSIGMQVPTEAELKLWVADAVNLANSAAGVKTPT